MKSARTKSPAPPRGEDAPIVGIGASAGGLEAFTQLLKQTAARHRGSVSCWCSISIPLHEKRGSRKLLARATGAAGAGSGSITCAWKPITFYVIPPNTSMGIARGRLQLAAAHAQRHPPPVPLISFLKPSPRDQQERSVGVILSGNASDGTIGLEAIKAEGGLTLRAGTTLPATIPCPAGAIAAGCVDAVLAPGAHCPGAGRASRDIPM